MLRAKSIDLFEKLVRLCVQIIFAFHHFRDGLAGRKEGAFFLEYDALSMVFPIF
jgi:hypothetical protein